MHAVHVTPCAVVEKDHVAAVKQMQGVLDVPRVVERGAPGRVEPAFGNANRATYIWPLGRFFALEVQPVVISDFVSRPG